MAESVNATLQYGSLVGNHGGRLGSPARDLGVRLPPQRARTQQVRGNPYPLEGQPTGVWASPGKRLGRGNLSELRVLGLPPVTNCRYFAHNYLRFVTCSCDGNLANLAGREPAACGCKSHREHQCQRDGNPADLTVSDTVAWGCKSPRWHQSGTGLKEGHQHRKLDSGQVRFLRSRPDGLVAKPAERVSQKH